MSLRTLRSHCCGSGNDRFDNIKIAGASTDIAFKFMPYRYFIDIRTIPSDDIDSGHDHPGGAKATLQGMMFAERSLHGMQRAVNFETFNRSNLGTLTGHGESSAAFYGFSIKMNHAGTTLARIAANVSSRQSQVVAQKIHQ
jgi:hypothetical protein